MILPKIFNDFKLVYMQNENPINLGYSSKEDFKAQVVIVSEKFFIQKVKFISEHKSEHLIELEAQSKLATFHMSGAFRLLKADPQFPHAVNCDNTIDCNCHYLNEEFADRVWNSEEFKQQSKIIDAIELEEKRILNDFVYQEDIS